LTTDWDLSEPGAYLGIEPIAVHAQVARRIAQADEARQKHVQASRADFETALDQYTAGTGRLQQLIAKNSPHP